MSNRGTPDDDDEFNMDWLDNADLTPQDDAVDLFGAGASENIHGDRERDEGIGQAQYGRVITRRMEDSIEKAEKADFGDTDTLLDWMAEPVATEADLPEWLRDVVPPQANPQEIAAARQSVLGDRPADEAPTETPSWLQGMSFNQPSSNQWVAHSGMTGNLSGSGSDLEPLWTPRTDTSDSEASASQFLAHTGDTNKLGDTGSWLSDARFDENDAPADRSSVRDSGFSMADFGLAGVEPLRTEEVPVVQPDAFYNFLSDDVTDVPIAPASPVVPAPDPDMFGFEDFTSYGMDAPASESDDTLFTSPDDDEAAWTSLMQNEFAAYVPPSAPAPALDINADLFDFGDLLNDAADDDDELDTETVAPQPTRQPQSLSEQLDADLFMLLEDEAASSEQPDADLFTLLEDEASSTLPRTSYQLSPPDDYHAPVASDVPDWLRGAAPIEDAAERDWLSDFEAVESADPLADLQLPTIPEGGIRTLTNLDSSGDTPNWLSRLATSDELPRVASSDAPTDDPEFNTLLQGISNERSTEALDSLLEQMRVQQETQPEALSFREMFDSNLFDKNSIAELDDDINVMRSDTSLEDLFASGLFDTNELEPLDMEALATQADISAMFDASDALPNGFGIADSGLVTDSDLPAWLQGAQNASAVSTSLAAALRAQTDKPLSALDDRLLALREEGQSVRVDEEASSGLMNDILPGVTDILASNTFAPTLSGGAGGLIFTADQQKRAALLEALIEGDTTPQTDQHARRQWLPIVRVAVMALLALAVLLPLLTALPVNVNPSAAFASDSRQQAALVALDGLPAGSLVLVALDYSAAEAPELDDVTRVLLRHLQGRGAIPIVISSDSIGIVRAQTLLEQVYPNGANRDYYVTRLIVGGAVGLRSLTTNAASVLNSDASGVPNGLTITGLNDFAAGIVVSSSLETTRAYAEQIIPQTDAPFVLGTAYSALPASLPYYTARQYVGIVAGTRDALVYSAAIGGNPILPVAPNAAPTSEDANSLILPIETTAEPTAVPTQRPTRVPATLRATVETTVEALIEATAETILPLTTITRTSVMPAPQSTNAPSRPTQPVSTVSGVPSATPRPSLTPRAAASATTEPTVRVGTIIADGTINVRENPSADSNVIGTLEPQQVVRVLNVNEGNTWVSVVLPDNRIGWVAAFLIEVEERPRSDTPFSKLPAIYVKPQQITSEASIQVGTVIVDGPLAVLDRPATAGSPLAQVGRGDQLRVLLVEGDYASIVLADGRIGYVETFALDITTRPEAAASALQAPNLTLVPSTSTPRPTRTPLPIETATAVVTPVAEATDTLAGLADAPPPVSAVSATVLAGQAEGGQRWQSQVFGLLAALGVIMIGNLFYLIRGLGRRGRRSV